MQPLQCAADVVEPALGGAAVGPGRWFVGVAVLLTAGDILLVVQQALVGNHSAQSHASLRVASPGHAISY